MEEVNFKRLALRDVSPRITIYYKHNLGTLIRQKLGLQGGVDLIKRFVCGQFGGIVGWPEGKNAMRALHQLLCYEISVRPSEVWFNYVGQNIRFSHPEFALVTGLMFGECSFDMSAFYHPTQSGVYDRFNGGRPIEAKHLLNWFCNYEPDGVSDDDLIKLSNILALFFWFYAPAETKKIDTWIWVLADDMDQWNAFPWGAFTYEAMLHYLSYVPNSLDLVGSKYNLYGPIWAVQVWAYEAIPSFGARCATLLNPDGYPRYLRWSFNDADQRDIARFFKRQMRDSVVYEMLVPTEIEENCPYWQSAVGSNPFGLHFPVPLNPLQPAQYDQDGQRILIRRTEESRRSSSRGVVGEEEEQEEEHTVVESRRVQRRARRTQACSSAARDASAVGETSSFLDPRIEAMIRRSIEENFERCEQNMMNRIDDYHRTLSQELVSRCEELLDRSNMSFQSGYSWHAQATQWPRWDEPAPPTFNQHGQAMDVEPGGELDMFEPSNSLAQSFEQYLSSETLAFRRPDGFPLQREWFKDFLKIDSEMDCEMINCYIQSLRVRLAQGNLPMTPDAQYTVVADSTVFMSIVNAWVKGVKNPESKRHENDNDYKWVPKEEDLQCVMGNPELGTRDWYSAKYIIFPILAAHHWFVLRLCISDWKLEMFDSKNDFRDPNVFNWRVKCLIAFRKCIARFLLHGNYWACNAYGYPFPGGKRPSVVLMDDEEQYLQLDAYSCGVFTCMTIERLLTGFPTRVWGNEERNMVKYRNWMAVKCFEMCDIGNV